MNVHKLVRMCNELLMKSLTRSAKLFSAVDVDVDVDDDGELDTKNSAWCVRLRINCRLYVGTSDMGQL